MTTGVGGCGGGCSGGCGDRSHIMTRVRPILDRRLLTPAQAAEVARANGTYNDWVTDVPVQGPTDPGIRAAGCWWKDNVLDKVTNEQGAVVPRWTQSSLLCVDGGAREAIYRGGKRIGALGADPPIVAAPATAANSPPSQSTLPAPAAPPAGGGPPAPPGIWSRLSDAESHWIASTLIQLNALIIKAGNKPCATWPADLLKDDATAITKMPAAVACFQGWYNTNLSPNWKLRTDGTLDEATACALVVTTGQHAADFPTPYPGVLNCGLSTLAKVGIGVGIAATIGGFIAAVAAASHKKKPASAPAAAAGEAHRTVRYGGKRR
jgi:hypothetical protein